MTDAYADGERRAYRTRRATTAVAWGASACALGLMLIVGIDVMDVLAEMRASHPVTQVRFETITLLGNGTSDRTSFQLWTDRADARARLDVLQPGRAPVIVYYVRQHDAWYGVSAVAGGGRWTYRRLAPTQVPSMATVPQLRVLFLHLRASAGMRVYRVGLDHHIVAVFTTHSLPWPFPYQGAATVWLDDVTGLPRQLRLTGSVAHTHLVSITRLQRLETVATAALPPELLTVPHQEFTPWDLLRQQVRRLLWAGRSSQVSDAG